MKIYLFHNEWKIKCYLRFTKTEGMESLIKFMKQNGFFEAPCSAGHHLNCDGGLAAHVISVLDFATDTACRYSIPIHPHSIIKCALLHDICKMFFYQKVNDKWEKTVQGKVTPFHAEASLKIIESFIKLTKLEREMILWHMGPYSEFYDGHKPGDFFKWSNDKENPNINASLFLYFCDHFSSMFLED